MRLLVLISVLVAVAALPSLGAMSSDVCHTWTNCQNSSDAAYTTWLGNPLRSDTKEFRASMTRAEQIIRKNGPVKSVDVSLILHLTVQYLCGYSVIELAKINHVITKMPWKPINITFSHVVCNRESDTHISYVAVLDEPSQAAMAAFVASIESEMVKHGIPVNVPRAQQEPFHSTLAVVSGEDYPVAASLEEVNAQVPVWNSQPILFHSFEATPLPDLFHAHD